MGKRVVVFAGNECQKEKEQYYYPLAFNLGKLLAKEKFVVITGGGPGLMNEVLRAAYLAGGKTIGVRLQIENRIQSPYVTRYFQYKNLRPRQNKLLKLAQAFLALPGGIGTIFEIFEVLTLKRKNEIPRNTPLVLIDKYFICTKDLINLMLVEGFVREEINSIIHFVQTPQEAVDILKRYKI